jgi:hypothetical protein
VLGAVQGNLGAQLRPRGWITFFSYSTAEGEAEKYALVPSELFSNNFPEILRRQNMNSECHLAPSPERNCNNLKLTEFQA